MKKKKTLFSSIFCLYSRSYDFCYCCSSAFCCLLLLFSFHSLILMYIFSLISSVWSLTQSHHNCRPTRNMRMCKCKYTKILWIDVLRKKKNWILFFSRLWQEYHGKNSSDTTTIAYDDGILIQLIQL